MNKLLLVFLYLLLGSFSGFAFSAGGLFSSEPQGLGILVFEGAELHPELKTRVISKEQPIRHVPPHLVPQNPYISTGFSFVQAIARSGSQGRLDGTGIESALFALYVHEKELGFYGFEVKTIADADRLEAELREIWKHNISINRAKIYRKHKVLLVIWSDGVPVAVWESVNAKLKARIKQMNSLTE